MQAVTEKLMTFALGRSLRYQDMPTVRAIVRKAATEGNTFRVARPRSCRQRGVPDEGSSRPRCTTQTAANTPDLR